jgi:hypothetical protein
MQRVLIYSILCSSLVAGASACSRGDDSGAYRESAQRALPDRDHIEVTGCLTANRETNQFVVTANKTALTSLTNRTGAGEAESFHYQLIGGHDLQQHIGREVVVKGSIEGRGDDVNIESKDRVTREPKSRGEEATPAIESKHEIEMQVERLNVASITPTGSRCQLGQP